MANDVKKGKTNKAPTPKGTRMYMKTWVWRCGKCYTYNNGARKVCRTCSKPIDPKERK